MINKVDLITPYKSQYDALHHFTKKLYEAWLRAGYKTRYFSDADAALDILVKDPPDLMIGFNGIPHKNHKYYADIVKKPYLSLLVDPFYRFFNLIESPYVIIGCDDFSGVSAFRNNWNFHRVLFVPHAVEPDLIPYPEVEKIFDVTLLATFIDYETRQKEWNSKYPHLVCKAMNEIAERVFFDPSFLFFEAIVSQMHLIFQQHPKLKVKNPFDIFMDIELYIKGRERIDMLKAIKTAQVHVFGDSVDDSNWEKYFKNQKNIIVHDSVSYEQSLEIMKQSKIVLNSSLKNPFGAHERIFSGIASGALVITNENPYLKKYFLHDFDIAFFQVNHLEQIDAIIEMYLSDEEKRLSVVERGREIVLNFHTWDARIKTFQEELFPMIQTMNRAHHSS